MNIVSNPSTVIQPVERVCPRCGTVLGGFGPEGLCPACLLRGGLGVAEEAPANEPGANVFLPRRFGNYELLEEIARGGMGVIYKARQVKLNRSVALKLILSGQHAGVAELARFRAEAETAARLQHPNIVAIHEVGEHEGQPFFSMDYVAGQNLAQLVGNAPLPADRAAKYLQAIAEAVHYAHQQGILHRDLKPSNVLIGDTDQPRVTDFGLAKRLEGDASLTMTGQVLGSPSFMSPEQAAGKQGDIGPASDVYSLGAMLYHALTGRPPFVAESVPATLRMVAEAEAISPRLLNASVPRDLETICLKCLQKEPVRRYETAREFAEDLARFLRDEPIKARPAGKAEKAWRWCRRNRALSATLMAVVILLVLIIVGAPVAFVRIVRERDRAEDNAARERVQRELAASQRALAQDLAEKNRVNLYAAKIKVADQAFKGSDVGRTMSVLESLIPKEGESDLRSFDWYYLRQKCQGERAAADLSNRVFCVKYSTKGKLVAVACENSPVYILDAKSGTELARLGEKTNGIGGVAFSPDDKTVAACGSDGVVWIWDLESKILLRRLQAETNSLRTISFSPDGSKLAALEGSLPPISGTPRDVYAPNIGAGRLHLWETQDFKLLRSILAHASSSMALAFAPDGQTIATGGQDGMVKLYEVGTGELLAIKSNLVGNVYGLAFVRNGTSLAVLNWFPYYDSAEFRLLNVETLSEERFISGNLGKVISMAASRDGDRIVMGSVDLTVRVFDMETTRETEAYAGHTQPVYGLAFSPDGETIVTGGWDGVVKFWDAKHDAAVQSIATPCTYCVSFSPDGQLLANSGSGGVELRLTATGELLTTFTIKGIQETMDVMCQFTPDGENLLTCDTTGFVHVFDVKKKYEKHAFKAHDSPVWTLTFSSDGAKFATAGGLGDPTVRIWDMHSFQQLMSLEGHTKTVTALSFSRDGAKVISGNWVETMQWDLTTGKLLQRKPELAPRIAVSHDGKLLASPTFAKRIKIRDADSLADRVTMLGHKDAIYQVAFSHDDKLLASASWDGTVKLWQVATGEELLNFPSLGGLAWSVAFSPDDRTLAFTYNANTRQHGMLRIIRTERPLPPKPLAPP